MIEEDILNRILEEHVKAVLGNLPRLPLSIDFSQDWHKYAINLEELEAEIVDLSAEGISLPYTGHNGKALKIPLDAGETKYLRLPIYNGTNILFRLMAYAKGTAKIVYREHWGFEVDMLNVTDTWDVELAGWARHKDAIRLEGGSDGGTIYI